MLAFPSEMPRLKKDPVDPPVAKTVNANVIAVKQKDRRQGGSRRKTRRVSLGPG